MSAIGSLDLWTSSKVIGRECSTVNKDYLLCKKNAGGSNINTDPEVCVDQSKLVSSCATNIVSELKTKFPVEFDSFKKCLDYNDYTYENCRVAEKALHECWNKEKGY